MKYLKKFERETNVYLVDALKYFFKQYDLFKISNVGTYYQHSLKIAKSRNIPEFLYDEFTILFFLYNHKGWWNNYYDKPVIDFIKKEIKKETVKSIINKFEKNPEYYIKLLEYLEEHTIADAYDSTIKYIYFLFHAAIKNAPDWLKNSEKYNL